MGFVNATESCRFTTFFSKCDDIFRRLGKSSGNLTYDLFGGINHKHIAHPCVAIMNKGSSINDVTQFWTISDPPPQQSKALVLSSKNY